MPKTMLNNPKGKIKTRASEFFPLKINLYSLQKLYVIRRIHRLPLTNGKSGFLKSILLMDIFPLFVRVRHSFQYLTLTALVTKEKSSDVGITRILTVKLIVNVQRSSHALV
jgi:hypothetical protein